MSMSKDRNVKSRPKKIIDNSTRERLIKAIDVGCTYDLACKSAGLARASFFEWQTIYKKISHLSEDEARDHQDWLYWELFTKIEAAEGKAAERWLRTIEKASDVQWQAAAWILERWHKESYGRASIEMHVNSNQDDLDKAKEEISKLKTNNPNL